MKTIYIIPLTLLDICIVIGSMLLLFIYLAAPQVLLGAIVVGVIIGVGVWVYGGEVANHDKNQGDKIKSRGKWIIGLSIASIFGVLIIGVIVMVIAILVIAGGMLR